MQSIINTIIKRICSEVVILYRMGEYHTLSEVIDMVYREIDRHNLNVNKILYKDYIEQELQKKLQYKLKKAN